ncbi:glycine--tRNA ligase [Chlamydia sp.]|uniref:glycine--tRNA ligase n=1 Tax=Chlamydia sp. TaxID=35827 RepID=UPI0025BF6588|nr:glycine--tRNA ligase [Chlamydia sp.]MBQ8498559.1 glycine--tRNA ligase [Chlamydia sp.]
MPSQPLTLQAMMAAILHFWSEQGCVIHQGYDLEVGAGTFNPATFLQALGPEPFKAAYVEPSRRPQDGRYGQHPNRLQKYHQLQVLLKPVPENFLSLYLESLKVIGLNLTDHDIRFVHDDWENPTIGAWGLGWEVWLNGMEITQLTYFQAVGSKPLDTISGEITYGIERIAMYLQKKNSVYEVMWNDSLTYGDITQYAEQAWSQYNFETANTQMWLKHFEDFAAEALATLDQDLPLPAYDFVIKASHAFNMLDSRGVISVTERTRYITRIRQLARAVADKYLIWRESLKFPLLTTVPTVPATTPKKIPQVCQIEDFLLEIGSEELPATFVPIGIQQLESLSKKLLAEHSISYDSLEVLGTPRRLALRIKGLSPVTIRPESEKKGPPLSLLFLEDGSPSSQGEQFFASHGLSISHRSALDRPCTVCCIRSINGADYLFLITPEERKETATILVNELPLLIRAMRFPKKMTWDHGGIEYARPIRWLVALYGDQILPISLGFVSSGNTSWGHRQLDNRQITIPSSSAYIDTLREACVIVSHRERRDIIEQGLRNLAGDQIVAIAPGHLIEETVFLTEHPFVISAQFDPKFCSLPKELLIAEMINHQRYFPTQNQEGKITNHFFIVCDNSPTDIIVEGNEKALTPRLTDGDFLFNHDLHTPLTSLVEQLGSVTYFESLGSLTDKTARLKMHLEEAYQLLPLCSQEDIVTAIHYCKADLVSAVVNEFPELQGIMGRYYLQNASLSKAAAIAIGEHLQHITLGSSISTTGALLSILDRADNLLSCFILGLFPTSSHDPYALRRQSLEILTLLHTTQSSINIEEFFSRLIRHFPSTIVKAPDEIVNKLTAFIWGRLKTVLSSLGFDKEIIATVLTDSCPKNPLTIIQSAQSIQDLKNSQTLEVIAATHNRLKKILASLSFSVTEHIFSLQTEEDISFKQALENFAQKTAALPMSSREYLCLLKDLSHSTEFFLDSVRVACDDENIRNQRIALLVEAQKAFGFYSWDVL